MHVSTKIITLHFTWRSRGNSPQKPNCFKTREPYGPGALTWILAHKEIMYWLVANEISVKDISNFSSSGHVVQLNCRLWSILVEDIMRNNTVKLFWIWTSGSGEDVFLRIFSSRALVSPLICRVGTICAILVEDIMRNKLLKLLWIWTSFSEEDIIKHISYLELSQPLCLAEHNQLCIFGRGNHEEQFFEITFNLDQWLRRRCHLKISYLELWQLLCLAEQNRLCNWGRRHQKELSC